MLEVRDIKKEYKTGNLIQKALDGVSLNFRDNEFVAILGPSGSGKTTLLNIIGGLDKYDSGDLIINHVSTKKYKDRDWDSYRNHTIGFVFQSYNLIYHQTVLANVELALTISGISKSKRKELALDALDKVGLKEQAYKKPNQMSGGQQQRVAIARALVNNPDILLADEPTGALDTDTSVQIMELLKEVAKDRLVVMVTHNPELAYDYASRIVKVKDGKIIDDSNPYIVEETEVSHANLGKASMSFLTALSLSFNNLLTKKARTILIAFASSIGIIGIALILSLSTGMNEYIQNVEESTLSEYPIQITSDSYSLASMMNVYNIEDNAEKQKDAEVTEIKTITAMFGGTVSNDLVSFKKYFEENKNVLSSYIKSYSYGYGIQPLIYTYSSENENYRQVNPDTLLSDMGMTSTSTSSIANMFMNSDSFRRLPEDENLYINAYDVKAGRFPENDHELVIILSESGFIPDITLYTLGLKDYDELKELIKSFNANEQINDVGETLMLKYEDLLGVEFRLVSKGSLYSYDEKLKLWVDNSKDDEFMKSVLENSPVLKVVGVIQPNNKETGLLSSGIGYSPNLLHEVINSSKETDIFKQQISEPSINVFTQKAFDDESKAFAFELSDLFSINSKQMMNAFKFDLSKLNIDYSKLMNGVVVNELVTFEEISNVLPNISNEQFKELVDGVFSEIKNDELEKMFSELLTDFISESSKDPSTNISLFPNALEEYLKTDSFKETLTNDLQPIMKAWISSQVNQKLISETIKVVLKDFQQFLIDNDYNDITLFDQYLNEYLASPVGQQNISNAISNMIFNMEDIELSAADINNISKNIIDGYEIFAINNNKPQLSKIVKLFTEYIKSGNGKTLISNFIASHIDEERLKDNFTILSDDVKDEVSPKISNLIENVITRLMNKVSSNIPNILNDVSDSIPNAINFNANAFSKAIKLNFSEENITSLFTSMFSQNQTSLENNLKSLGYADYDSPTSITIYPKDFESKNVIKNFIDDYNEFQRKNNNEDSIIDFQDVMGNMMNGVTKIINGVTYVLIAFVAISLVVSSIMIGVITYISVLERKKEIGILRAIGASKKNVSNVFNAETVIIGFLAGSIGIGISRLLIIPINIVFEKFTGGTDIKAILPINAMFILIALSVLLTFIGGLIPASKASNSNLVESLRNE